MASDFINKLDKLHEMNHHKEVIAEVEAVPEFERSYEVVCRYARAFNNLSDYERGYEILLSLEEEGRKDGMWNHRIGYSLYYMNREEEAVYYLERALALELNDEETRADTTYLMITARIYAASKKLDEDGRMILANTVIDEYQKLPESERYYGITKIYAEALTDLGHLDEALYTYMQIEGDGQHDPFWNYKVALIYCYMEQEEDAVKFIKEALSVSGDNAALKEYLERFLKNVQEAVISKKVQQSKQNSSKNFFNKPC